MLYISPTCDGKYFELLSNTLVYWLVYSTSVYFYFRSWFPVCQRELNTVVYWKHKLAFSCITFFSVEPTVSRKYIVIILSTSTIFGLPYCWVQLKNTSTLLFDYMWLTWHLLLSHFYFWVDCFFSKPWLNFCSSSNLMQQEKSQNPHQIWPCLALLSDRVISVVILCSHCHNLHIANSIIHPFSSLYPQWRAMPGDTLWGHWGYMRLAAFLKLPKVKRLWTITLPCFYRNQETL